MTSFIPAPYRILALVLFAIALLGFGYMEGVANESDRRDAQDLQRERQSQQHFLDALKNGRQHAANAAEWQQKARTYYANWREALQHESESTLAQCAQIGNEAPAVLLSSRWVGLYNAAWLPKPDKQSDTGGTFNLPIGTGSVTPLEALANVGINAELCATDRKRYRELIDHLKEIGGNSHE